MKRLFTILTAAFLVSCELFVEIDVPFEGKQVTVNSFFNPDSLFSVHLSLNRHILDEKPFQNIQNARVILFDGDSPIDTLSYKGQGNFRSDDCKPEPGKTYSLSVSTPGYKQVHSSSSVPFPSPIISAEAYEQAGNQTSMVKVRLQDNGAEANYYELFVEGESEYYSFPRDDIDSYRYRIQLKTDDPAVQHDDNDEFSNSIVFKDVVFNGKEVELIFELSGGGLSYNSAILITLRTLSEDGYNYLRTARIQEATSGDPFAQPINVFNNIQNGFGIFAGYSTSAHAAGKPKPVITSIDPPSGKPGDVIVISGENFLTLPDEFVNVIFNGTQFPVGGYIVSATSTRVEVIVPEMAETGKVVLQNFGRAAVSESEFVVTN